VHNKNRLGTHGMEFWRSMGVIYIYIYIYMKGKGNSAESRGTYTI
jgi:hypothetical protein